METILLLGDSLIEYGDWSTLLPGYQAINRGIAGETVGELAGRLGREIDLEKDPEKIIILSGTNNMLMGDESFPVVFETMLPRLRQFCPGTLVTVTGLAPLPLPWVTRERVEQVNLALERTAATAGCSFLDLSPVFDLYCRPVGNPCFLPDGVHFSPHGYQILAGAIIRHLKSLS